jgi:5-(carboxyamino)imidazole ribonucleotide mutase
MPKKIVVALIMGSKSDEEFLQSSFGLLDEFGIVWEKQALSAHRQADKLTAYIASAEKRGAQIFIAAAGLSAALPGVVASQTLKPVIGIPVPGGPLKGIDALLSIVQMPGGIPLATMGIGSHGPKNAALLAIQILSLNDEKLADKFKSYRKKLSEG